MNGVDRLITREDDQRINNAILSFPAGDPFIKTTLETFTEKFNGSLWVIAINIGKQRSGMSY